jgi:hypothetical protein
MRLIRYATLQVEFAGRQILVNQILAEPRAASAERNLMVPRPYSFEDCFDRMPQS